MQQKYIFPLLLIIGFLLYSCGKLAPITFLDYANKLDVNNETDTIEVLYLAWACACANWIETDYFDKHTNYQDIDYSKDCFFIEAEKGTEKVTGKYHNSAQRIQLVGHFYEDLGISRDYIIPTSQKPEYARVFRYLKFEVIEKNITEKELPIDTLWNTLVFKNGGCLAGGQYSPDSEGCILNNDEWNTFLNMPKRELTSFLIEQFADTSKTKIHTCPFFGATAGEVAVYALQKIYYKNWFEFAAFRKHLNMETTSGVDNRQVWLQKILENEETRDVLADYWLNE